MKRLKLCVVVFEILFNLSYFQPDTILLTPCIARNDFNSLWASQISVTGVCDRFGDELNLWKLKIHDILICFGTNSKIMSSN